MRHLRLTGILTCIALVAMPALSNVAVAQTKGMIGINVLLKTDVTKAILTDLGTHGTVRGVLAEIRAVTVQVKASELAAIKALPYAASADPDAERKVVPVTTAVATTDSSSGIDTWDLDVINVTDFGTTARQVAYDGTGVYVADLKAGPLARSPVVINMSLGGPNLDVMEKAAIDYAVGKGVNHRCSGWQRRRGRDGVSRRP
ncbi:MAG: hypothetical protein ACYDH4_07730 [Candidatus Cryosericum sp.]